MILKNGIELVYSKVVISGRIVEIYDYERPVERGYESKGGRDKKADAEESGKNREKTLKRARQDIRRIVNANVGAYGDDFTAKFLTLTFADNVTDIEKANTEFKRFVKRMNYHLFGTKKGNLRYTVVPEFQDRGSVHYHVIIYNIPYTKSEYIEKIWKNGFIKINKIDNVNNVGAYICKYLTKANDDDRLKGKKCYFNSRGLYKPIEITDEKKAEKIKGSLPEEKKVYDREYENEYTGKTVYKQYNLNIT